MLKHITSTLLGILCVLSFLSVRAEAIDNIKGVQPSNLANTLYSKQSGSGYQGTFFIKSPELIEIGNKMLKRAGVQYTLTQENTRGNLANYVTTESALEETNATQQKHTSETTSFSQINHQVQSQQTEESANNSNLQKIGVLFSDVSDLLQ
jgi:hypothetical protein